MYPQVLEKLKQVDDRKWEELFIDDSSVLAARRLYSELRRLSTASTPIYICKPKAWDDDSDWDGLKDRIEKASTGTLRNERGDWTLTEKNNSSQ